MNLSNLNKKRARPTDSFTITLGKLHHSYYYISDSLTGGKKIIKISMIDLSNNKEDEKFIPLKEKEEDDDVPLDIIDLSNKILKDEIPQIVNDIKSNEYEPIYLPISASWFNIDNIHEIEIKSLPEFFCGKYPSKTPQIYKNYRNFIINLYRENSTKYLTSSTCRKHLPGDTCSILRIHAFLEHWGIINFKQKIKPNFIPKAINIKSPIYIDSDLFMLDNTKNNENFTKYNNPENSIVMTNNKKQIATLYPINKISNKIFNNFIDNINCNNIIDDNDNIDIKKLQKINFLLKNYRPKCDLCSNFCTIDWYVTRGTIENIGISNDINISINNNDEKNIKKDFYLICEECYLNNEISLPFNLKKENFELSSIYNLFSKEKLNSKVIDKINEEKWTEEENNVLMEGIKNNNTWEEIIKSLGNNSKKTKNDCILHLLQLPISNIEQKNDNIEKEELMGEDKEDEKINIINIDEDKEEEQKEIVNIDEKKDNEEKIINENNINENKEEKEEKEEEKEEEKKGENEDKEKKEDKGDKEKNDEMNIINIIEDNNKNKNENMNNKMIEIFMKLFRRYLNENGEEKENESSGVNTVNQNFKEVIYKTFVKSINKSIELKNEEKDKMKNIVDILVYLEMKKIELKMNYFKQFEKVLEYKKNQIKTIETQIIQENIKLLIKKFLLQQKEQQIKENK